MKLADGGDAAGVVTLSVPRLGLKDVALPTGSTQAELDREGVLRLRGSGLPWREGSNTFIAGHALGFPPDQGALRLLRARRDDAGGRDPPRGRRRTRYAFRVYDRLTVEPDDFWVTYPVEGKTVSLAPDLHPRPEPSRTAS
jgi:sortase A